MGKSSSGKDTLYKKLLADPELSLKTITMYTTRPIRSHEVEGKEYHFVSVKEMERLEKEGRIIERRTYATACGDWHYFTVDDRDADPEHNDYLMIGTIESYVKMRDHYGPEKVCPMMIETDDGVRLMRALRREISQENPKYKELCRRFLADEEDFSAEKKREAGIDKEFRNDDLQQCYQQMKSYILEVCKGV